jgi:restriction system protein
MWTQTRHHSHLGALAEIDVMGGLEFEAYIADLLRHHGYRNVFLTEPSDLGVDIVAERNGECWGIQTKRYAGRVSDYAVKQVVAGLKPYHCSRSMVITNSAYTNRARKLGKSNNCVLVDRIELARLISDVVSTGKRKYSRGWRQTLLPWLGL